MLRKIKWSKVHDNGICQNLSLKLSPEKKVKIKMLKFLSIGQIGKKYLCMYQSIMSMFKKCFQLLAETGQLVFTLFIYKRHKFLSLVFA